MSNYNPKLIQTKATPCSVNLCHNEVLGLYERARRPNFFLSHLDIKQRTAVIHTMLVKFVVFMCLIEKSCLLWYILRVSVYNMVTLRVSITLAGEFGQTKMIILFKKCYQIRFNYVIFDSGTGTLCVLTGFHSPLFKLCALDFLLFLSLPF